MSFLSCFKDSPHPHEIQTELIFNNTLPMNNENLYYIDEIFNASDFKP